jgi:ABC-2 type transport system permease protein
MMPILAVLVPIITAKSFMIERQSGADRLLYSLPLTSSEVVLGKYAALISVFAIPVAFMAVLPPFISLFGEINILSAYLCLLDFFAFGAALIAVCMFISSVSKSTVVSLSVSYGALVVLYLLNMLSGALPNGSFFARLLSYVSMFGSIDSLVYCLFDIRTLLYYISITAVFVFLTVRSFEKKRLA